MNRSWIVGAVAISLVAFLSLYFVLRGESDENSGAARPRGFTGMVSAGQSFDTWFDYVADRGSSSSNPHKVVFVGIDGGCWNIIDPLIDEGLLPTLKKLKENGAHGILRSVEAYVSPPAWTTMTTGFLPERTGVFTFGVWDDERREFMELTARDVAVPSVWDVTSFLGKRTAVINVPVTYPVREVDGIMVSGLLTPASLDEREIRRLEFHASGGTGSVQGGQRSFSPVLSTTFNYTSTQFAVLLLDTRDDGQVNYDRVVLKITYTDQTDGPFTDEFPLGRYSEWARVQKEKDGKRQMGWCKVLVFPTDKPETYAIERSRVFFDIGDTDVVFTYPDTLQRVLKDKFGRYFPSKFLDRGVVPSHTEDAVKYASFFYGYDDWDLFFYVFTQTDNIQHLDGVTAITKQVYQTIDRFLGDLVKKLPKNTTLIIASDHGFKHYELSVDLNKVLERMGMLVYRDGKEIDYDKTLVFHNMWHLYFNDALLNGGELKKRGIDVPPGSSPREALAKTLERARPSFTIPSGQAISVELLPFPKNDFEETPDMVVKGTYSNYMVEFWNLRQSGEAMIHKLRPHEQWNHTREGMYLFYGEGVRRGFPGPVENIEDVTPTILYLLDLPLAEQMDGRVMHSVLDSRQLTRNWYPVVKQYNQIYAEATTDEEREVLEEKLRTLGYIR